MAFDFGSIFDNIGTEEIIGAIIGGAINSQGSDTTTTQINKPYLYPGQEQGIADYMALGRQEYEAGPIEYYPGQQVADLDENVIAGQNMALSAVDNQQQLADLMAYGVGDLANGGAGRIGAVTLPDQVGWGISQGLQDAVTNPIYRDLEERILPSTDLSATNQGAFGGTRHQQLRGQAAANATDQATEALARANLSARDQNINQRSQDINALMQGRRQDINQNNLYNQAVRNGLDMIPKAQGSALIPANTAGTVGRARTAYEQKLLDADRARFDFNQRAPINALTRFGERMTLAAPTGSQTVIPGQDSSWVDILGGVLGGGSLFGDIFGGDD